MSRSLSERIDGDFKAALKSQDKATLSCLRMVRAALHLKAKDNQGQLSEDQELAVLGTLAKQRREAAEKFRQGGREDLAAQEEAELSLIEDYLPAQLGEQEISQALDQIFAELDPQGSQDMGKVMKAAMARFAGRADGKLVNALVRQRLS